MVEKVLSHLRCMLCGGVQRWEGGREGGFGCGCGGQVGRRAFHGSEGQ